MAIKCSLCNKPIKEKDYRTKLIQGFFGSKRLRMHWSCFEKLKK